MRFVIAAIAALTLASPAPAFAAVCSINTTTGVSFGSYNVFDAAAIVAAGSITYACTGVQVGDRVVIEAAGVSDASTPRTMSSGTLSLGYQALAYARRVSAAARCARYNRTAREAPRQPGQGREAAD
jgi:spore coat protein U-like protein